MDIRKSSPERVRIWQDHVKAQLRSGLSIGRYCREQGLARSAFGYWRRKLGSAPAPDPADLSPVTIVPVPMHVLRSAEAQPASRLSSLLSLTIASRFRIEIEGDFSAPVLKKLVTTLEQLA